MPHGLSFLLDFDGTVTAKDMSVEIVRCFVDPEDLKEVARPDTPRDWFVLMASLLPRDGERILEYAMDSHELRPGFKEFVRWAQARSYGISIATDGFGFYVEPILEAAGIRGIQVFRNRVEFAPTFRAIPGYPHETCTLCGTCKVGCLRDLKKRYGEVVFVGDGDNDTFPGVQADAVFARDDLRRIFEREGLPFLAWESFFDIVDTMEGSFSGGAPLPGPSASKCPVPWG